MTNWCQISTPRSRLLQKLVLSYESPCPQPHEFGPHLHPTVFSRSILILSYDMCLWLSAGLSSSIQNFYVFLITPLYSTYLTHSIGLFDYPNNIWQRVWIMKLLIMQFSPAGVTSSLLGSKYSPQHPVLCSSFEVGHYVSQPFKTTGKSVV